MTTFRGNGHTLRPGKTYKMGRTEFTLLKMVMNVVDTTAVMILGSAIVSTGFNHAHSMGAKAVLGLPVAVHNTPRLIRKLLCQPYMYLHDVHLHTAVVSFHRSYALPSHPQVPTPPPSLSVYMPTHVLQQHDQPQIYRLCVKHILFLKRQKSVQLDFLFKRL